MIHARILISLYLLNPMFNRVKIIVAIKITFHDHVCVLQEGVTLLESFYVSVKYRACIYQLFVQDERFMYDCPVAVCSSFRCRR